MFKGIACACALCRDEKRANTIDGGSSLKLDTVTMLILVGFEKFCHEGFVGSKLLTRCHSRIIRKGIAWSLKS